MASRVLLRVTIDHHVIFSWAHRRGAQPATCEGDERPWPLFFNFGSANAGLKEIGWDKFFTEFERADLALVYREADPSVERDDFHEFVRRAAVVELIISGESTITKEVM